MLKKHESRFSAAVARFQFEFFVLFMTTLIIEMAIIDPNLQPVIVFATSLVVVRVH